MLAKWYTKAGKQKFTLVSGTKSLLQGSPFRCVVTFLTITAVLSDACIALLSWAISYICLASFCELFDLFIDDHTKSRQACPYLSAVPCPVYLTCALKIRPLGSKGSC